MKTTFVYADKGVARGEVGRGLGLEGLVGKRLAGVLAAAVKVLTAGAFECAMARSGQLHRVFVVINELCFRNVSQILSKYVIRFTKWVSEITCKGAHSVATAVFLFPFSALALREVIAGLPRTMRLRI